MMKTFQVAVLALTLTASAAFAQQGGCVSIIAGSQQKNKGAVDTTFSATSVIDVDLAVVFTPGAAKRFANDHLVEFRVFTPSGRLYQSLTIPFTNDPTRKGKHVRIPGYPDPVPSTTFTEIDNKSKNLALLMRLPVAGTNIVTNSLYGKWSAQAYVDGEQIPCSSAAEFFITQ